MIEGLKALYAKVVSIVTQDGISSLGHGLVVLAGLPVGLLTWPLLGALYSAYMSGWYTRREQVDYRNAITPVKKRDAIRDFGFPHLALVIVVGALYL